LEKKELEDIVVHLLKFAKIKDVDIKILDVHGKDVQDIKN